MWTLDPAKHARAGTTGSYPGECDKPITRDNFREDDNWAGEQQEARLTVFRHQPRLDDHPHRIPVDFPARSVKNLDMGDDPWARSPLLLPVDRTGDVHPCLLHNEMMEIEWIGPG